ncbi:MAG: DUF481 domain-containing protein [Caulobacterales bacterium]
MKAYVFGLAVAVGCSVAARTAQAAPEDDGWSGEGSLSAGITTGNTDTSDVGVGLKAAYQSGLWKNSGEFRFDYAQQDDEESKNRIYGAYQLDRILSERAFAFARSSFERDEFSGFDSRIFIGGGLGYKVIDNTSTNWELQGGPGLKIDDIEARPATLTSPAVAGGVKNSIGAQLNSAFQHSFNENVSFSNDTELLYADVSTQVSNEVALTAKVSKRLSGRFSFEVRYETDPPVDRKDTDTATRFSLVYGIQ